MADLEEVTTEDSDEDVAAPQSSTQEAMGEGPRDYIAIVPRIVSLLFVSSKPLPVEVLAEAAQLSVSTVEDALSEVKQLFIDEVHGFSLHEVVGGFQFRTAPQAAQYIRRLVPVRERRLSRAAAETLAVIAYKQPVERAEIESIRGVDALPTLKTLLETRLIRVVGKQDTPGQPALYGTTNYFLEKFGLRDLSELPTLREFEQLVEEPGEGELAEVEMSTAEDDDDETRYVDKRECDDEFATTDVATMDESIQ